jgi:hypothetical protein
MGRKGIAEEMPIQLCNGRKTKKIQFRNSGKRKQQCENVL